MERQIAKTILMIQPVNFGYNEQTAVNNFFQQQSDDLQDAIQANALAEFNAMVELLQQHNIDVIIVEDATEPRTPDSIFPNNWISFHADGTVVLYPMFALNRRAERRSDILHTLTNKGVSIQEIVDYTTYEQQNQFLEGTGSIILDRQHKIAYAAISERTNAELFQQFCDDLHHVPVSFRANQSVGNQRLPIYHTNVMMCVAEQFAVVCLDTLDNGDDRNRIVESFRRTKKELIEISEEQMQHFAGNMLQVENKDGKKFLIMSATAYNSLTAVQINRLKAYNDILTPSIPTIEKHGGGSVRCMMAEIFQ